VPVARDLAARYLFALGAGVVFWSLSLAAPAPARPWLWAVGLAVELAIPLLSLEVDVRTPINPEHIPERFGLFTIILLGESILAIVRGIAGTEWRPATVATAVGGFAAIACLWWAYFGCVHARMLGPRATRAGQIFVYAHLPLLLGLTTVAVGTEHAIKEAGGGTFTTATLWALCGGVALYLFCVAVLRRAAERSGPAKIPTGVAVLALGLAIVGGPLPSLVGGGILLAGLIVAGGIEVLRADGGASEAALVEPDGAEAESGESLCAHLDQVHDVEPRTPEGCAECLKTGDKWVELRLCLVCGEVGCCDNSKNKHATAHFHREGHPLVQSYERGEDWRWCYVDQTYV
jgi:hypothetical protein